MNKRFAEIVPQAPVDMAYTYEVPADMALKTGMRVIIPFGGRNVVGFVTAVHETRPDLAAIRPVTSVIDSEAIFNDKFISLARSIGAWYVAKLGDVYQCALPSGKSRKHRVAQSARETAAPPVLSPVQQRACDEILASDARIHLLHGITGSGKTEVYISLCREVLSRGRSVIFLVPEISLSTQLYTRFERVFGNDLVLYHSETSPNYRLDCWCRFFAGEKHIVVGTRSAVFLQAPDLGLIVIDEEHDHSYKDSSSPRYNARRVATFRSEIEGCKVVLGSATPSLESFYSATKGPIHLATLAERYGSARLPEVEIVETDETVSPRLRALTLEQTREGNQAIFLLNRRGFAPVVYCTSCKKRQMCPDCSIPLTLHRGGFLICHTCEYKRPMSPRCDYCKEDSLITLGSGTQSIEEQIEREFPALAVKRMDRDSMRSKKDYDTAISGMEQGHFDILIGTQMVAKGFDFANVTLIGVLAADMGLALPDFRALERTFSLLVQVSGRCGRADKPGRVVIQSMCGEGAFWESVVRSDYISFYNDEIAKRREAGYPPFVRLVRIVFRGKDESRVLEAASGAAQLLRKWLDAQKNIVLGPAPAPYERIATNYRWQIVIKSGDIAPLRRALRELPPFAGVYFEIDVDPVDLL